jgi:hypothetical protein
MLPARRAAGERGSDHWPAPRPTPTPAQEDTLRVAFSEYGTVQHVKVIKDKGGESQGRGSPHPCLLHPLRGCFPALSLFVVCVKCMVGAIHPGQPPSGFAQWPGLLDL